MNGFLLTDIPRKRQNELVTENEWGVNCRVTVSLAENKCRVTVSTNKIVVTDV